MKRILLFVAIVFATLSVQAQDVYMAGQVSLWRNDDANKTNFLIAPELGVALDESWSIGSEFIYSYKYDDKLKTNTFAIAPYVRYSFYNNNNVRLFIDGGFGYSTSKVKGHDDSDNGFEIGLKPGIAIKLNNNFSILAKVGFVGYSDDYLNEKSDNGFGFKLNGENLSLGIHYEF